MSAFLRARSELFEVWKEKKGKSRDIKMKHVRDHVLSKLDRISKENCRNLKKSVARFCTDLEKRWLKANNTLSRFLESNGDWLKGNEVLNPTQNKSKGRPKKQFAELNKQNKRRRVKEIRNSATSKELAFATEMQVRADGSEDAAKLVNEALQTTPTRATKIRQAWKSHVDTKLERFLTDDEALALFIDGDFSKEQWTLLRKSVKQCNVPQFYPSYKRLILYFSLVFPDNS